MIFEYDQLKSFLLHIRQNYEVTPLGVWNGTNGIILRHDVDFDIQAAYDLAVLEKECEVRSTFFIMTTSFTYNILTIDNQAKLQEMSNWGFEIGLHFDPVVYGNISFEELSGKVDFEAHILSTIIDGPIKSISIHNPSIHGKYPIFEGYRNAYDEMIFSADNYISDSRMSFNTDIYEFVKKARTDSLQILLHPLHYTADGKKYPEIISLFVTDFVNKVDAMWSVNSTYRDSMHGDLLSYIFNEIG